MTRKTILVVEDEADLRKVLRYNLERDGFRVHTASNGADGIARARARKPDLVMLDVMLPDIDGVEVCRRLRADEATAATPIIMVTAKGDESDVVLGLGMGADDYVAKPFSVKELIARVKAVLRRGLSAAMDEPNAVLRRGPVEIDSARHEVRVDGDALELTATEFRLLRAVARHPGRVYTREELLAKAVGDDVIVQERTIDVHVRSIRSKLGPHRELIQTVRGVGYRFQDLEA